jgi:hypothetical protein
MNEQPEKQRKKGRGGNHPENVLPYRMKKGETRNPKGYPKVLRERDEFRRLCATLWENGREDLIAAVKDGVSRRKFEFVKEGMERFFGKVANKNIVTGADGGPVEISVTVANKEAQKRMDELRKRIQGD